MKPEVTFLEEMLRAATRSGLWGLLILAAFTGVYLVGVWHAVRCRPERALQKTVICVFLVAVFNLQGFHYCFAALPYVNAGCGQYALLLWNSYLRLKLSLILVCSLAPVVLLALTLRQRNSRFWNPGCFPGALAALLCTVILELYVLACVFGSTVAASARDVYRLQDLLITERGHKNAEPSAAPLPRAPQAGPSEGAR